MRSSASINWPRASPTRWFRSAVTREEVIRQIPNVLSLARLLATPFVVIFLMSGDRRGALWICLAAGLTDMLDGYLARRLGSQSQTGAYLDPIADKVMLSATYLAFGIGGLAPAWLVAIVFGRDALMLVALTGFLLFTDLRSFPPTVWGKLSTAIQIAFVLAVLTGYSSRWFEWLTAATTAWSGAHYFWVGLNLLRSRESIGTTASPD